MNRVRITTSRVMILVAFVALALGAAIHEMRWRQRERELLGLLADYQRHTDRVSWAEKMVEKGYLPKARLKEEQLALKKVEAQFLAPQIAIGK